MTESTIFNGVKSGYTDIDEATGGFHNGDLILLSGRPSMGKTAFALGIVKNICLDHTKKCVYFSYEMSKQQLVERLICSAACVENENIKRGNLDEDDRKRLNEATENLETSGLLIWDIMLPIEDMIKKAIEIVEEKTPDLLIVDYLELLSCNPDERTSQVIDSIRILDRLKALAIKIDRPILVISQLNRSVEERSNHRPLLSDLIGETVDHVDEVLFLYRDGYYDKDTDQKGIAEINIAKCNSGQGQTLQLAFIPEYVRFFSLNDNDYDRNDRNWLSGK